MILKLKINSIKNKVSFKKLRTFPKNIITIIIN